MDIKDFILIGGGILIALVVGHGFWIAWRAKREPLRMDIVPDLIPDDMDEIERLRGELPNGGARVVKRSAQGQDPQNLELDLAAPVLMEPANSAATEPVIGSPAAVKDSVHTADAAAAPPPRKAPFDRPKKLRAHMHQTTTAHSDLTADKAVDDVQTTLLTDDVDVTAVTTFEPLVAQRPQVREVELQPQAIVSEPPATGRRQKESRADKRKKRDSAKQEQVAAVDPAPVEELLIINVLALKGERFDGEGLVTALRKQGLRYGDMNIFHRVDPATKAKQYSVANAIEPGTFDLSDLSTMRSPGMTFFLQLPGPDDALGVFDDMLKAARNVTLDLGGELRDEELSVLTGQSTEHMRQRIADYARRRLSKRA